MKHYEVQEYTFCDGWINNWTDCDGNPEIYVTREEAQQELDEFLEDIHEAFLLGYIDDDYNKENYRIVEVNDEQ